MFGSKPQEKQVKKLKDKAKSTPKRRLKFFRLSPFDKERYDQLLNGLNPNEILFSEISLHKRLDADFAAHPKTVWIKKVIQRKHFEPLSELVTHISSGHTPH